MKIEDMTQEALDELLSEKSKMESALDRYKKENEKFRTQRDEYKAAAESNEANAKFKERALQAEAKLRVANLGIKDPDRIVKYLKLDGVEFDEEGNLNGLDESIETVKADFPELFDAKRRVGGKVDAAADGPVRTEKSVTELQVDRLFQKR